MLTSIFNAILVPNLLHFGVILAVLGGSGGILGRLGRVLAPLGGLLGWLWPVLSASWRILGRLGCVLARLWRVLPRFGGFWLEKPPNINLTDMGTGSAVLFGSSLWQPLGVIFPSWIYLEASWIACSARFARCARSLAALASQ